MVSPLKSAFPGNIPPTREEINEFCAAGKTGDIGKLKDALDKFGASILNERDDGRDTALTWAAWNGKIDAVEFLLARGAGLEAPGMHGKTALIWAAQGGRKDVVALLLEKGANINAKDDNGETALTLADRNNLQEVSKQLRSWVEDQKRLAEERKRDAEQKKIQDEARALATERLGRLKGKAPKIKIAPRPPGH
jgi:hypothetical protein